MKKFPYFKQRDTMDCGPTCLLMVAAYYGKNYDLPFLRESSHISREGVSLQGISHAAEKIGFRTMAVKIPFEGNIKEDQIGLLDAPLPCIVHWNQSHFVVVYKVTSNFIWVADPGSGKFKLPRKSFMKSWSSPDEFGFALLLEPLPEFFTNEPQSSPQSPTLLALLGYLVPFKYLMLNVVIAMVLGSIFQVIFPFLAQSIVDVGIENKQMGFIYLISMAQFILFLSRIIIDFIQNKILLHIGSRINVALVNDFLSQIMRLPIGFFDSKMTGDLMQRMGDQKRIETFLTHSALGVIFSLFNFVLFSALLIMYNATVFVIFSVSSICYFTWIALFMRKRKEMDYIRFQQMSNNQNSVIELIEGMQEIKLQGSENKRRWRWASLQAKLFHISLRSLHLGQLQDAGAAFINQLKDIIIIFVAAQSVINGHMSLGMMMGMQYIVAQLNAPLGQFIAFIRAAQDAKLSLERLLEIKNQTPEEAVIADSFENNISQISFSEEVSSTNDLYLKNVSFRYNALANEVIKNLDITIPAGKVTAIVGASGSGKTTLLKLLLGFYKPTQGKILIGQSDLLSLSPAEWRKHCGAVMQGGYLFSDTIANNIAESDEAPNKTKLLKAVQMANIQSFIESLPTSYNTIIGARGTGISQGQRQRLLIARAVYKNPHFLFLDEATNSLDTNNERVIVENLHQFFQNRTVVVVAHRLSTVKNADKIVVLEHGEIIEEGTHMELVAKRGAYFNLVRNQLELDT
jgi:ATP-binding cassette, subfamily B, bacterial